MNINDLFKTELYVINSGVDTFHEACRLQDVPSIQVDFRPPAAGNEKLIKILDKLRNL